MYVDGGSGSGAQSMIVPAVVSADIAPTTVSSRTKAHESGGQCVSFRPQGKKIATAGNDGILKLWNTSLSPDCKEIRISTGPVSCLQFNTIGSVIAAGDSNSQINLVKVKPGLEIATRLQGHQDIVN
jgi:WD40 repeat protein